MRLSKIYTKNGDGGQTSLVGGDKISKADMRLETYGTTDELNAHVGMLRTLALKCEQAAVKEQLTEQLRVIQNKLFDVGSDLATMPGSPYKRKDLILPSDIEALEEWLDEMNEPLETLRSFTLPGGGELNAWAHMCRTVCRRAERQACRLADQEEVTSGVIQYLNRLSDYFFVLSRWISLKLGDEEFLWDRPLSKS
jgi:cob(I)alamin adenosyltransferase